MSKILLYGISSYKNHGVEALAYSTISQISGDNDISMAVFDYEYNSQIFKDEVKYVHHYLNDESKMNEKEKQEIERIKSEKFDYNKYELFYERETIKELAKSDIAIHLGGDNYCYNYNSWLYAFNTKAKELNKKLVLWGASLFDEINDAELITDLDKYDLLMIREKTSYNAIKKYIDEDKLMLVPDSAFSLKKTEVKLDDWYKGRKVLGLNVSPLVIKSDDDFNTIIDFVDYILSKTDYSISLLPHVTVEEVSDLLILDRIKEHYKDEDRIFAESGNWNCTEIKYIISKCDFIVAARTHASIAAYSTCVPTLVLGYSVKSRGIAEDLFGSYKDYVLPLDDFNSENLINMFKNLDNKKEEIKKTLSKKMERIVPEAGNLFNKMMERLEYLDSKKICDHNKCSGCTACANICPVKAITMEKNEEGFYYPKIDLKKCIHCNKCRSVCPTLNKSVSKELECFAAKSRDDSIRKISSSGGIFTHLANYYLEKKGVVYGATLDDKFKVKHIRIDSKDDLKQIQGSKYAQSILDGVFQNVKEDLSKKKKVLFSGTPCQINGLKRYLGKEYENLLTVSVICHGVINSDLLAKRIDEFENKFNSKVDRVTYKSKKNGWECSSIFYEAEKINKLYKFNDDPMMFMFSKNFALRESCYNCSSKGDNNMADIILGDYWGVYNVHKELFDQQGVSCVIVKTEKGKGIFDLIKHELITTNTKYKEIVKYNPCLSTSVERPYYRSKFYNDIKNNELEMIYNCSNNDNGISNEQYNNLVDENKRIYAELVEANKRLESIYYSRSYKIYKLLKGIIKRK